MSDNAAARRWFAGDGWWLVVMANQVSLREA